MALVGILLIILEAQVDAFLRARYRQWCHSQDCEVQILLSLFLWNWLRKCMWHHILLRKCCLHLSLLLNNCELDLTPEQKKNISEYFKQIKLQTNLVPLLYFSFCGQHNTQCWTTYDYV